jgi:predicted small metal-binding protein
MIFRNTLVKEFTDNVLVGINRGVKFMANSNATVTNSIFKEMKQNRKEGKIYYSDLNHLGSAIGKRID